LDKNDPSGKCLEDACVMETGAVIVAGGLYVAAKACTAGSACESAASSALDSLISKIQGIFSKPDKPADKPTDKPSGGDKPRSNPLTGDPGTTSSTTTRDGKPKQDREYGDDGYPNRDVDHDHDHGQGQPHVHDWDRPSDGSPPTHDNRQPGRQPTPGEIDKIQNNRPVNPIDPSRAPSF
jgi:hypothetical protein